MLDLHEGTGLKAIRELGLYDKFMPLTGECTEDFLLHDRDGSCLKATIGERSRPEISRNNLTRLLLSQFPESSIQWEHKLLKATRASPDVDVRLEFSNGVTASSSIVVGADGAWSKIRVLLGGVQPHFTGTHLVTTTIRNITANYPHLAKLVGSGSFCSLGNRHGVFSQRGPIDSARLYLWLTMDEGAKIAKTMACKTAAEAKHDLLSPEGPLGAFGDNVKELVSAACDEETKDSPGELLDIRQLHTLPYGSTWEHQTGVTLIGDAAHLMLPNGEGVNFAMLDALVLAEALERAAGKPTTPCRAALDPLLLQFEKDMMERAIKTGKDTDQLIGLMLGGNEAAHDMLRFFESHGKPGPSDEE